MPLASPPLAHRGGEELGPLVGARGEGRADPRPRRLPPQPLRDLDVPRVVCPVGRGALDVPVGVGDGPVAPPLDERLRRSGGGQGGAEPPLSLLSWHRRAAAGRAGGGGGEGAAAGRVRGGCGRRLDAVEVVVLGGVVQRGLALLVDVVGVGACSQAEDAALCVPAEGGWG